MEFLNATYLDNLGIEDCRIVSQDLGRNILGFDSERDGGEAEAIGDDPVLVVSVTDLKTLEGFVSAVAVAAGRRLESESLTRGATLKLAVPQIAVSNTSQWLNMRIGLHCVTMAAVIFEIIKVGRN